MPKYTIPLIKSVEVARGTKAFHFKKPEDFIFKAGQFMEVNLINPPETDGEGNGRAFSIAAAPYEETLMIASRMRDTAFKRVLGSAPRGLELEIEGPFGSFTLHQNQSRPAVFLMGGIGITPVRSIALQATHDKLPHDLYLFYSNRTREDAAFLEELTNLEKENPHFHLIATMTDTTANPGTGETGYITKEMIERHLPSIQGPMYYLAGPPAMVMAMRQLLEGAGVSDDDIKSEEFSGY